MPIYISTLLVKNIHCPSCVSFTQDLLQHLDAVHQVDVSIIDHRLRVEHEGDIAHEITQILLEAAFEVEHVTVTDSSGHHVRSHAVRHDPVSSRCLFPPWQTSTSKAQKKHLENCDACQQEKQKRLLAQASWRGFTKRRRLLASPSQSSDLECASDTTVTEQTSTREPPIAAQDGSKGEEMAKDLHSTTISIRGMTCSSCVSAITKELDQMPGVDSVNVNLMTNNANITFHDTMCTSERLLGAIEDIGYDAQIEDVHPFFKTPDARSSYRAKLSIEGMTCGSCVGIISRRLQELSFIRNVTVDLISNSATIDFTDKHNLPDIIEAIEDLGYDASVTTVEPQSPDRCSDDKEKRKVDIAISGMYCSKCPSIITANIQREYSSNVTITREPTIDSASMTVVYIPSAPTLTIRSIIHFINSIDPAYTASVHHAPSLEERSHSIRRKERDRILRHLFLTFLVAIPSFIIGIVYMSLVPESNSTRQWLQQPIWAGSVSRMDWAMFIMTTPVMFYGANIFHSRALKEIWSLWKPASRVPILRRFYRFGSMNLLISAGTSIAYFSSLAVLIMDATSAPMMNQHKSTTYFDTVTFLTFFILIGRFLEAYSKAKTGDAVSMLSKLRPSEALLLELVPADVDEPEKSVLRRVPIDLLEVGDVVSIPHGASPPMDGEICQEGSFLFDESSLTGESRPVKKNKSHNVYTGTVNVSDPVRIRVTKRGGKTMLDQIVNVVREGQARRAPIERLADILTGYFTPAITLLAIITWIIWLALGESGALPGSWLDVTKGGWTFWSVEFAIAVFVVACPCGIGLAAPTALFVGGGLAAKHGILVQGGGEAFQEASRLDAIVFDKTGTLTEGKMKVAEVEFLDNETPQDEQMLSFALARALEESSNHPIAKAVVEHCIAQLGSNQFRFEAADIQEVSGQGMVGVFEVRTSSGSSKTYEAAIGNKRLLQTSTAIVSSITTKQSREKQKMTETSKAISNPVLNTVLSRLQTLSCSTAVLAMRLRSNEDDNSTQPMKPVAVFGITDPIRPEASTILSSLRSRNISVYMCTGDNHTTAHAIASQLEIPVSNVRAGAMPQEKAEFIRELQHPDSTSRRDFSPQTPSHLTRKIIAFVGDGTNDTPALTVSDVSMAISHPSSSNIALTSSSFILLNSSLDSILTLVTLSRRVFRRVKINFAWAGIYNVVLIPVAAGVFFAVGANDEHGGWRLSPVWASAAMAGSSVSVVLSSLALRLPEVRFREILNRMFWRKRKYEA